MACGAGLGAATAWRRLCSPCWKRRWSPREPHAPCV